MNIRLIQVRAVLVHWAVWGASAACAAPLVSALPVDERAAGASTALQQKLADGQAALGRREFDRARALYAEAANLDPRSPAPLLAQAELSRVRGEAADAKRWLTQALKLAPRHPHVLRAWAHWHYAAAQYPKAVEFWEASAAADPKFAPALIDLGDFQFNVRRDLAAAGEYYRRALAIDSEHAGAHYALGIVLLQQDKLNEARAQLERSSKLSPGNPLPLTAMAQVQARRKDVNGALALYDQALNAQPGFYSARLEKADLLLVSGRLDQALGEFKAVAQSDPKVAGAHVGAGMALQALRRPVEAMASYRAALAIEPDHAIALNNAAWLAAEGADGIADLGLAWAQKAVALAPQEPRFRGTLAWVHYRRGDSALAIQQLQQIVATDGKLLPQSHYLLGVVQAEKGDRQAAVLAFREALRLDPSFDRAQDAARQLKRLEGR